MFACPAVFGEHRRAWTRSSAIQSGVLKLSLGARGTYVLNKQAPNKQIWSSSPVGGPVRYDWQNGQWVYSRDGHEMLERMSNELTHLCGVPVDLRD